MKADERSNQREVPAGVDANAATREKSKAEELEALLEAHRGERHIIVMQSFPDPDAISSALAHQMIAARHDIECDIAYDGRVS
ncbi:MAG TPA: bifunctional oligoribonuclease/PAP phosphatase NrnA, partial [Blastocatellia bacterium]|nr:bifunctional oligoribonuclease/PAP phosphatase NrnA [Blastocatellia bacterium]